MHYYQDRLTKSIYSERELVGLTRSGEITPRELLARFEELTEQKRRLLEETEAAAAERRRGRFSERSARRAIGRPRFSFPGLRGHWVAPSPAAHDRLRKGSRWPSVPQIVGVWRIAQPGAGEGGP